jgi:hypothetical protein
MTGLTEGTGKPPADWDPDEATERILAAMAKHKVEETEGGYDENTAYRRDGNGWVAVGPRIR